MGSPSLGGEPKGQGELGGEDGAGDIEEALPAQIFEQGAAGEARDGSGGSPDDVVDADHVGQVGGRFAISDESFERGPGEAHAANRSGHDEDMTDRTVESEA